jgi:hypothetical protein
MHESQILNPVSDCFPCAVAGEGIRGLRPILHSRLAADPAFAARGRSSFRGSRPILHSRLAADPAFAARGRLFPLRRCW